MPADKISGEDMQLLIELLERRLEVIADSELRENDPEKQLALLQEVSENISDFHARHKADMSARLNHFLGNSSFDKALAWARDSQ
ncbi:MAG: hypothetical protein AAGF67_08395 [Verrucomicrobiota bacterium]